MNRLSRTKYVILMTLLSLLMLSQAHAARDYFHTGLNVGRSDLAKVIGGNGPGKIFYVDSTKGASNNSGTTWPTAVATLDAAVNLCTADSGDKIMVAANHAETVATASAITLDVAGVTIECLGEGENRPTFSFSATASTIVISAASVTMTNFVVKPTIDSVVSPIVVTGTDCVLDYEHQDTSATVEAVNSLLTTDAADRLTVNLKYRGFLAGGACVNAIRLVGVDSARIYVDFYGVASTAIVEFHTTACHDIDIEGIFYNDGTSLTKDVVDTATGSTWSAEGWDGNLSAKFAGGDNAALAADAIAGVAAAVVVVDAFHDVPVADVADNTVMSDVIGNKTDAAAAAGVSTDESIMAYAKQIVTAEIATVTARTVPVADAADNVDGYDVIGNKTDAAAAGPVSADESIVAYAKQNVTNTEAILVDTATTIPATLAAQDAIAETSVSSSTAVMVNGDTIFTIAGGPIKIVDLVSICITVNNATASTLQYSADPTIGAAITFSGASASLADFAAGGGVVLNQTALNTAPDLSVVMVGLGSVSTNKIIVNEGIITVVIGVGSTTGTWKHYLRYIPLSTGVTVTGT